MEKKKLTDHSWKTCHTTKTALRKPTHFHQNIVLVTSVSGVNAVAEKSKWSGFLKSNFVRGHIKTGADSELKAQKATAVVFLFTES